MLIGTVPQMPRWRDAAGLRSSSSSDRHLTSHNNSTILEIPLRHAPQWGKAPDNVRRSLGGTHAALSNTIVEVTAGCGANPQVFGKKAAATELDHRCLTVWFTNRSLNLEAPSPQVRDQWVKVGSCWLLLFWGFLVCFGVC